MSDRHQSESVIDFIGIRKSVMSIGFRVFAKCIGLTEISFPESVTSIEHGVFYGCSKLKKVLIYDSNTNITPCSFEGCDNLQEITILETDDSHKKSDKIIEMLPVALRAKVRVRSMFSERWDDWETNSYSSSSPSSFFSQGPSEDENSKGKEEEKVSPSSGLNHQG